MRNAFTAAWVMQVSYNPLLLALSINPSHSSYLLLKDGQSFSVNVLKKDQLNLGKTLHVAAGTGNDFKFSRNGHRLNRHQPEDVGTGKNEGSSLPRINRAS